MDRQPALEDKVRGELKQIDDLLDIKWYPAIRRYAVVARWPIGDSRYQMFQSGEIDDNHDILGWYAEDIQDADTPAVSIDSIDNKVLAAISRADNTRQPWQQRLIEMAAKNIKVRKDARQRLIDQAEQVAKDLYYMAGHNEESTMERIKQQAREEYNE